jgi:hypothetical protein
LEWREPIMLNVKFVFEPFNQFSWWMQFYDNEQVEPFLKDPPAKGSYSDVQIKRAAGLISGLLEFKQELDRHLFIGFNCLF